MRGEVPVLAVAVDPASAPADFQLSFFPVVVRGSRARGGSFPASASVSAAFSAERVLTIREISRIVNI